ncbi:hypothetical protein ACGF5M_00855 [Gemmatimonadota bacterium]
MIQLPKWTDPPKRESKLGPNPTVQEIDAEIRRPEKLKEDSERVIEEYHREMDAKEEGEKS